MILIAAPLFFVVASVDPIPIANVLVLSRHGLREALYWREALGAWGGILDEHLALIAIAIVIVDYSLAVVRR